MEDKFFTRSLITKSAPETEALGAKIASRAMRGDIIGLSGELGAGKTCLVRGAARFLGLPPNTPVLSPTFTIVNSYDLTLPFYHLDCYRLNEAEELVEIGVREFMHNSLLFVEWHDRFPDFFSSLALEIRIIIESEAVRSITLSGKERFSIE